MFAVPMKTTIVTILKLLSVLEHISLLSDTHGQYQQEPEQIFMFFKS